MSKVAAQALIAAAFWPSLFFFWALGPIVFYGLSMATADDCSMLQSRAEFLAEANRTLLMLAIQNLVYAVPIVCLVLWGRLLPAPARTKHIVTCIKLYAAAAVVSALWQYGGWLDCKGYGKVFFSSQWQMTGYLPFVSLILNVPLFVLAVSLGHAFSTRDDITPGGVIGPRQDDP